jgi:hypothetical protein
MTLFQGNHEQSGAQGSQRQGIRLRNRAIADDVVLQTCGAWDETNLSDDGRPELIVA